MTGIVLVNEKRVEKSSEIFPINSTIRLKGRGAESKYASRAGLKLEHALNCFSICPEGFVCLDIGASTGGFTDCLLKHGSKSVVAVDAGTNQLVWELRNDPRVDVRENTNARNLSKADFESCFDLITVDVSFISVKKILPALIPLLCSIGKVIVLIKPQFEAARHEIGEKGVLKDEAVQERIIREINACALSCGLEVKRVIDSPILGAKGNREFLAFYEISFGRRLEK